MSWVASKRLWCLLSPFHRSYLAYCMSRSPYGNLCAPTHTPSTRTLAHENRLNLNVLECVCVCVCATNMSLYILIHPYRYVAVAPPPAVCVRVCWCGLLSYRFLRGPCLLSFFYILAWLLFFLASTPSYFFHIQHFAGCLGIYTGFKIGIISRNIYEK